MSKILIDEATVKLALEALEWNMDYLPSQGYGTSMARKAITALREALAQQPAQPQQEWIEAACALIKAADDAAADRDYMLDSNDCIRVLRGEWKGGMLNDCPPTPQPAQRKPLTDEQIEGVFFGMGQFAKVDLKAFARAIETKLKEKNT